MNIAFIHIILLKNSKRCGILRTEGTPIGMRYRKHTDAEDSWTTYWFEKNMFGDVVAVYNSSGTKLVSYKYDAWFNFTSTTHAADSVGGSAKNPFKYRGYYYDSDLGFYVTGTRYYDPAIGRFINADSIFYLGASGSLISYNLYSYCDNNPVMGYDPLGRFDWKSLKEFGVNCIKSAVVLGAAAIAVLAIGSSIGGTIMSGGAGALSIPAAVVVATKALAVSAVAISTIGIASVTLSEVGSSVSNIVGENGTQTPSTTTWNGKGKERLDVENPSPGRRAGQIHYHNGQNGKHMFDFRTGKFVNPTKRLQDLMTDKGFLRGLRKAMEILGEWQ